MPSRFVTDDLKSYNFKFYINILIYLSKRDSYCSEISRDIGESYRTVHIKLYRLVDVGYIKQLNEIGVKYFSLTEKGESFVEELIA